VEAPEPGALAVLLSATAQGPVVAGDLLEVVAARKQPQDQGFSLLQALCAAAGLPSPDGFGTVRAPE
jgi:hypothetical protein